MKIIEKIASLSGKTLKVNVAEDDVRLGNEEYVEAIQVDTLNLLEKRGFLPSSPADEEVVRHIKEKTGEYEIISIDSGVKAIKRGGGKLNLTMEKTSS